ncbi:MAG: hypothetical protein AB7R90_10230 [Reyranellaceae bacterium]
MKANLPMAATLLAALLATSAVAQTRRSGGELDECTITAHANEIVRIVMVRLNNGLYSHKAYDEKGRFVCDGEWSATHELNRQAAEILRNKGNDRAVIVDRSATGGI